MEGLKFLYKGKAGTCKKCEYINTVDFRPGTRERHLHLKRFTVKQARGKITHMIKLKNDFYMYVSVGSVPCSIQQG